MNSEASENTAKLEGGAFAQAGQLWTALTAWAGEIAELVTLETKQAGRGLALMFACAVAGAILAVSAWFAILASVLLWIVEMGLPWPLALAMAALANLTGAGALIYILMRLSGHLLFVATRRQLLGRSRSPAAPGLTSAPPA
jgi:hypothetical protein